MTEPFTIPDTPSKSVGASASGNAIISQVEVPIILTNLPEPTPAPMAPTWASKAPTAIGIPCGIPNF